MKTADQSIGDSINTLWALYRSASPFFPERARVLRALSESYRALAALNACPTAPPESRNNPLALAAVVLEHAAELERGPQARAADVADRVRILARALASALEAGDAQ